MKWRSFIWILASVWRTETAKKQSKYKSMTKEIKMHKEINNIKMLLFIDL